MSSANLDKTLLVRVDKIGDLVVSLNADSHPALAGSSCTWMIAKGLGWVVDHAHPSKNYTEISKDFSISNLLNLVKIIRRQNFKTAIVFQAPWFVGLALWLARVPIRVGRKSQWHSFLFFNRGIRQKRSLAEKHESEYNWDLIDQGLRYQGEKKFVAPKLQPKDADTELKLLGLRSKTYSVVHPGMMGSALNWPHSQYISLIRQLSEQQTVVVTGTRSDEEWLAPLREELEEQKHIYWLDGMLSGPELIAVLSQASLVVAPSTGVIHLASALGVPVVGFYSPRISEKSTRWGPLSEKSLVFTPEVSFEDDPNCMSTIEAQKVFRSIQERFFSA